MLSIKRGVDLVGVTVPMLFATIIVNEVFKEYGQRSVITTGRNGDHGYASLHFTGNALDYRTKHIQEDEMKEEIKNEIKKRLGDQYDVVLHDYESEENPGHLHIEFQPKGKL